MTELTNKRVKDTYKQLLKIGVSANVGVSTTLTAVQTGDGQATAIKISKTAMQVNGPLGVTTSVCVSGELRVTDTVCASSFYGDGSNLTGVTMSVGGDISVSSIYVNNTATIGGAASIGGVLSVGGAVNLLSTATVSGAAGFLGTVRVSGATSLEAGLVVKGKAEFDDDVCVSGNTALVGDLTVGGTATVAGNVSIGGTSNITGKAEFEDDVSVSGGLVVGGTVTIAGANVQAANAKVCASAFYGDGANLTNVPVAITGNISVNNVTIGGTLHVGGITTVVGYTHFKDDVSVSGNVHIGGTTTIGGAVQLGSTLSVAGETHLQDAVSLASTLVVGGKAEFDSDVCVSGNTILVGDATIGGTLSVGGAVNLASTLTVAGKAEFDDAVCVSGNTILVGNLTVGGTTTIGGAVSISGALSVGGAANFASTVTVAGATHLQSTVSVNGAMTLNNDLDMQDDDKILLGTGDDLEIYHNGSHSYVKNGTGELYLAGDTVKIVNNAINENILVATADGAITLYYDNSAKIATTNIGATITGTLIATTDTDTSNTGSVTLDFAANQNFVLTFTGNVTFANPSTEQVGQSGIIVCIQDGTGSRTLSLGTDYETAGGAGITLSTAANAVDIIPYFVKASGSIQLGAVQLAFS